jgi:UDP-glucose 4-epimerase
VLVVRDRSVLVTGGAGFIGSHLCDRLLAEGALVVAVDDLSSGRISNLEGARRHERFTFVEQDVRAPSLRAVFERHRPDVVFHLAAQAGVRPSLDDPEHDARVNILGTLNVLSSSVASGARKVVYAASGGTLYGEPETVPVSEDDAEGAHPESPYGISKKVALEYGRFYTRHRGLEFTALALGNVYGPRQDPNGEAGVIAIFASAMLAGRAPTIFGDGEQTRDYVFVTDTVDAFVAAIDRAPGRLLNVGTGHQTTVNELQTMLSDIIGSAPAPTHGPQPVGELRRISLDAGAAEVALGWAARTSLTEGLARTVEHLRSVVQAPSS